MAAALAAQVLLVSPSVTSASLIRLDKDAQGGMSGAEVRPADGSGGPATFLLTSRSSIDETRPLTADAAGADGTVIIDKHGAGVRTADGKGSKGISGAGDHKDEELIFTYNEPVYLNSLVVGLNGIDFGIGTSDKDDPVIFLSVAGSGSFGVTIVESEIRQAFTSTGNKTGLVDFGLFASLDGEAGIDAFKIRETNDHIYVNLAAAGVAVPEPACLGVLGLGWLVIILRRRRSATIRLAA